MKKILVPTDFSKPAQWAAEVAVAVAKKAGAQIILLHVIEQPTSDSFSVEAQIQDETDWEDRLFTVKLVEKSKKQLAVEAQKILDAGVPVKQELRLGSPFHGMRLIIADHNVDLVVMGTLGHSKLEEMIVGSNTEKVVRHARCPVLTVHEKPSGKDFRNIVYATSMSEDEKSFAEVVVNTQEMYGSTIHLVRINTPMNFRPDSTVKEIMEKFAKKLRLKNYTLNMFSDFSEEEGIIHFANSINADLIAMSTHGRKGFAHVLVGSIAEDVANHATKPVLTYVANPVSSR